MLRGPGYKHTILYLLYCRHGSWLCPSGWRLVCASKTIIKELKKKPWEAESWEAELKTSVLKPSEIQIVVCLTVQGLPVLSSPALLLLWEGISLVFWEYQLDLENLETACLSPLHPWVKKMEETKNSCRKWSCQTNCLNRVLRTMGWGLIHPLAPLLNLAAWEILPLAPL